ncbi:MAG: DUF4232 domain-containing protein [Acidimicrobiales bacterium]
MPRRPLHGVSLALRYQGQVGATGTLHVWYAFTNFGSRPCTLYGYPGYQPLDANGHPLPEHLGRTEHPGSGFNGGPFYAFLRAASNGNARSWERGLLPGGFRRHGPDMGPPGIPGVSSVTTSEPTCSREVVLSSPLASERSRTTCR